MKLFTSPIFMDLEHLQLKCRGKVLGPPLPLYVRAYSVNNEMVYRVEEEILTYYHFGEETFR